MHAQAVPSTDTTLANGRRGRRAAAEFLSESGRESIFREVPNMALSSQQFGAVLGLLAAVSFGVRAPLAKLLLADLSPQLLAGLLYLGAGVALALYRLARPATREVPLTRADLPSLVGVVALGGVAGPLLVTSSLGEKHFRAAADRHSIDVTG